MIEACSYVSRSTTLHAVFVFHADCAPFKLYLTLRFLWPLIVVHFGGTGLLLPLRRVVRRTCIGTGITLLSLLTVKISLLMFNGEPAWLCCMTCKLDGTELISMSEQVMVADSSLSQLSYRASASTGSQPPKRTTPATKSTLRKS